MFSNLGVLSNTAASYCHTLRLHVDSSSVSQFEGPTCLMSSFPTLAMNFIAAVSATRPLQSESINVDAPEAVDVRSPMTVSTAPQTSKGPGRPPEPLQATKSRRRSSQSKTSYHIAHPAPSSRHRQRFRIRPRTLLQLQRISNTSRPTPVFDVLPSVLFAPRLARRAPQIFQRQGLGLDDLVVVHSQTQEPTIAAQNRSAQGVADECPNDHVVIATICQLKQKNGNGQSRTELRFSHDSLWTANALRSGAYEFVCHQNGEARSIARWVPKRESHVGGSMNTQDSRRTNAQAFKFSLIDTTSRRHPVIANMNRQSIDIYDRYSIPSTPRSAYQPTDTESVYSTGMVDCAEAKFSECNEPHKTVIETDVHLRSLVTVTGIWVALCEEWSPNFMYGTKQVISNEISEVSNRRRSNTTNTASYTADEPHRQQLESTNGLRYRPGMVHTSSHSAVPSSPPLSSPMVSTRRTVSSSAPGFYGDYSARHPSSETDHQPSTFLSDDGSDAKHGFSRSNQITTAISERKAGERVGADKSSLADSYMGKGSGQDMISEATLVEEELKRPSRLKRVMGRLRRTRTTGL